LSGALRLDFSLPLRNFDVALALDVQGTVALVGPSGAGKTTVLRAVAGLVRPESGHIGCGDETWFDATRRVDVPPEDRRVGYVFQEYALFPHLTVEQNVAYAGGRADRLLWRLGIERLARSKPAELSGGERQRVALARALARNPQVLLLDEPMAALDPHTRGNVRTELHDLFGDLGLPTLLVTHDFEDAAALADRVGVLADGRLRQIGTPGDLLGAPADPFVAQLAGANVLPGVAARAAHGLTGVLLDAGPTIYATDPGSGRTDVVVYPWDVSIAREALDDSALNHVRDEIVSLTQLGNRARVRLRLLTAEITTASAERLALRPGEPVVASFKATQARLLTRQ